MSKSGRRQFDLRWGVNGPVGTPPPVQVHEALADARQLLSSVKHSADDIRYGGAEAALTAISELAMAVQKLIEVAETQGVRLQHALQKRSTIG